MNGGKISKYCGRGVNLKKNWIKYKKEAGFLMRMAGFSSALVKTYEFL